MLWTLLLLQGYEGRTICPAPSSSLTLAPGVAHQRGTSGDVSAVIPATLPHEVVYRPRINHPPPPHLSPVQNFPNQPSLFPLSGGPETDTTSLSSLQYSIHSIYANYNGRYHPTAGAVFYPGSYRLPPSDPDLDPNDSDSEPVPIPDEVLAACDSINWRFGTPAEPARAEPSGPVVPAAVASAAKKKRKETGVKDAASTATATDQKPSRKRKGGRPPKARAAAPPPSSNPTAN